MLVPPRCRRFVLLAAPLLLPLLAHADGLKGLDILFEVLFVGGLVLLALLTLTVALVIVSYQRPERRGLYVAQLVLLVVNVLAGLALLPVLQELRRLLPLNFNPCWQLVLPLGLWLNGIRWARQATTDAGRCGSVATAVIGLSWLLGLPPSLALNTWLAAYPSYYLNSALVQVLFLLPATVVALGSWTLVSRRLRGYLPATVWLPWWRLPLLVAVGNAMLSLLTTWATYAFTEYLRLDVTLALRIFGQSLATAWVLGVLALLLLRPAQRATTDAA